jgi:ribonuclease HI
VSKQINGPKMTNNIAELTAVIECLCMLPKDKKIGIYTDSQYAILCCTTYGEKCEKKKWKDIPNSELVKKGYELLKSMSNCSLVHVTAHTLKCDVHSNGNREADRLSKQFSE